MSGLSNLPPGVTGQEWEIAGYPPCGHMGCGHADTDHAPEWVDGACNVKGCECEDYTPYSDHDEYEPDLDNEPVRFQRDGIDYDSSSQ